MNRQQQWLDRFFSGSAAEKLARARALYHDHGPDLAADPEISRILTRLRAADRELAAQMARMNMGKRCAACAARTGGCCSAYMATNTDVIQLVINMLLGREVAPVNPDPESCRYLGPQGCQFAIKPIFCLNYNCTHILDNASGREMAELERRAGAVLGLQIELERLILTRLG